MKLLAGWRLLKQRLILEWNSRGRDFNFHSACISSACWCVTLTLVNAVFLIEDTTGCVRNGRYSGPGGPTTKSLLALYPPTRIDSNLYSNLYLESHVAGKDVRQAVSTMRCLCLCCLHYLPVFVYSDLESLSVPPLHKSSTRDERRWSTYHPRFPPAFDYPTRPICEHMDAWH